MDLLTRDFFGVLKGMTKSQMKIATLKIYRYYYRFSMEKLSEAIDHPKMFRVICLYLKRSNLQSLKEKPVIKKSLKNHFRGLENMLNQSSYKHDYIRLLAHKSWVSINTVGDIAISESKI